MRVFCTFLLNVILTSLFGQITPPFLKDYNKKWVDSIFHSLTLEEKIGQVLMPRGNYSGKPYDEVQLVEWVTKYKIGGLVWFAGKPTAQAILTNKLQAASKIPLLIGEDFEWGLAMRIDSTVRFPYQMALGSNENNEELIERMGREIAKQCKRLGVHVNYAPVVDVNNNPLNPVINFRSFGEDKFRVTNYALAYMKGMQSEKLISTAKHFPGHGDTQVDSHVDLPIINHSLDRLHELELYPFKQMIKNGISGIMTAHLSIPAIDNTPNLASTLSPKVISDLLKKELRFEGLIFTDAMEMKAINKYHPNGEAIVKALIAGNDIIETFIDVPIAVEAIKKAITEKRISLADLDQKVLKILKAKSYVGLHEYKPIIIDNLVNDLNTHESFVLNSLFANKSLTLTHDKNQLIPITNYTQKIAVVSVDEKEITHFQKMAEKFSNVSFINIPINASDSLIELAINELEKFDIILAGIHLQEVRASNNYGLNDSNKKIISILSNKKNTIITYFGNAMGINSISGLGTNASFLVAYQNTTYAQEAAIQAIFGAIGINGTLPVTINPEFNIGKGIKKNEINILGYGIPEQTGINGLTLSSKIDSIVNLGLKEKAYPGAVVLVAHKGKIIFNKAYGFHVYNNQKYLDPENLIIEKAKDVMDEKISGKADDNHILKKELNSNKVKTDDIYDLASITKIAASALALMQESSKGNFDINSAFEKYVPSLHNSNIASLKFKDMLTHRSGLKDWIAFWKNTIDTTATFKKAIVQSPTLLNEVVYTEKKPCFLAKLFGKKAKRIYDYKSTAINKPLLWQKIITPENIVWISGIYNAIKSNQYDLQIGYSLYLNKKYKEEIFNTIAIAPLNQKQGYVYSDLHYYYYPDMIKNITGMEWTKYLSQTYNGIGAFSLMFNPKERYGLNKIMPTEYDSVFRKRLIHGYVHDEGAAMLGGISGHAGLFGNAPDLAKLMQLYLQKGNYGGKPYFSSNVIDQFTSYQFPEEKNRRGLAFDKPSLDSKISNAPSLASDKSYGHSGFTGTYVWVDPKYEMIYIFLSNRVFPTRKNNLLSSLNIRTTLGDVIINEILKSQN